MGHGGTLDPMAEGVLPVAIGRATRLLRFLPSDKRYRTTVLLGKCSDTDDLEGSLEGAGAGEPDAKLLQDILASQRGAIDQMVPAYSAVHVKGKRLYKMARQGEAPLDLPVKRVVIHSLELTDSRAIEHEGVACWQLSLDIHCSAGTYIRSIARDVGAALGCGGCMSSLQRSWASGLDAATAVGIERLCDEGVEPFLVDPKEVVDLPLMELSEEQWTLLKTGRQIGLQGYERGEDALLGCLFDQKLCAVIKPADGCWRSEVVIAS